MSSQPRSDLYAITDDAPRWRGPVSATISNAEVDRYVSDATGYEPPLEHACEVMPTWELAKRESGIYIQSMSVFSSSGRRYLWVCLSVPILIGAVLFVATPIRWWALLVIAGLEWWLLILLSASHAASVDNPDLGRVTPDGLELMRAKRLIARDHVVRFEVVSVRYHHRAFANSGTWIESHLVCCVRDQPSELSWVPIIGGHAGIGGWNWGMPKELSRLLGVPLRRTTVRLFKQC